MTGSALIALTGVVKSWRSVDRRFELHVPELTLKTGDLIVLSGPNGTGKTTLLELLGIASQPDSGRLDVTIGEGIVDVSALWKAGKFRRLAELRAAAFGFILQTIQLLPFVSVYDNAALAQRISGRRDHEHLKYLFTALGLNGCEDALPETLSPGLRQRAAVARALANRPLFVLADEPTASLDPDGGREVMALLLSLAREHGSAVMLSTHQAAEMAIDDAVHIRTRQVADERADVIRAVVERMVQ